MLPLIVSIISIFVVTGVAATVYVQAAKQRDLYNKRLAEVVGKTNSANQYEFEKNKDQEVSLERVRGDVVKFDGQISGLNKSVENVKAEYGSRIADMSSTMNNVNKEVTKTLGAIQTVSEKQTDSIAAFRETLGQTTGEVRTLNSQMAVVNGKLVNIGEKQQAAIDKLLGDTASIKTEQGDLRDYVYSNQTKTASAITSQNDTLAGFQSTTNARLVKQDEQISKAYNVAKSVQNVVTTLDTAIENVRAKFADYVSKTDILNYATKDDLSTVNNTFQGYVSTTDFTTYKNSLPLMYTAQEMDALKKSFVTTTDIQTLLNTLTKAQADLATLKSITDTLGGTYATKQDLIAITGSITQETVNIGTLGVLINSLDTQLKTTVTNLQSLTSQFTAQEMQIPLTYSKISYVNGEITRLEGLINNLKTKTNWILNSLTIDGNFTAIGSAVMNDIKFTKDYSGYPESGNDRSEISNDVSQNKKLLLVGNKSAGGKREVGVWDNLTVNGNLTLEGTGVDTNSKISGPNVHATGQMMVGANGDKGWFKSDGTGFVSGDFGVGALPSDPLFGSGKKQMVIKGTKPNDWQVLLNNTNGNRNIWMNHGGGSGMEINTNDSQATNYAIRTLNDKGKTFEVMNDGKTNIYGSLNVRNAGNTGALGPISGNLDVANISGTTAGKVLVGGGTAGVTGPANLHWDGTKLGIGNSAPTSTLDVFGDIKSSGNLNVGGAITGSGAGLTNVPATSISGTTANNLIMGSATGLSSINKMTWDGMKLNVNAPTGSTFPSGWGGSTNQAGILTFDVYSAGGTLGAGDAAGNVKASINRDGIVSASNTLCIRDICVTYDDLKRVKGLDTDVYGPPLYLWEGRTPITTSSTIKSRYALLPSTTAVTENTTHNAAMWYGHYMFGFASTTLTNARPTNFVRFLLPIDPTNHNAVFFLPIAGDRWSVLNVWLCDNLGNLKSKLQTRTTSTKYIGTMGVSSYLGPTNKPAKELYFYGNPNANAADNRGHEWVQVTIPKSISDLQGIKTSTNEVYIAVNAGGNNSDSNPPYLWIAGVATCANPYGLCSITPADASWANNGGTSIPGLAEDMQGESAVKLDVNATYNDVRIPIADSTKDLIIGWIDCNNSSSYPGLSNVVLTVPNITTQYKVTAAPLGIFAKNLSSRGHNKTPRTFLIPAASVLAATTNNGNGELQVKVSITTTGLPEPIYFRGFYTEIYMGF